MLNLIPALILLILQGPATPESQVPSWQVTALVHQVVMMTQGPLAAAAFEAECKPESPLNKFVQEVSESEPVDRFPEPAQRLAQGHRHSSRSRDGPAR